MTTAERTGNLEVVDHVPGPQRIESKEDRGEREIAAYERRHHHLDETGMIAAVRLEIAELGRVFAKDQLDAARTYTILETKIGELKKNDSSKFSLEMIIRDGAGEVVGTLGTGGAIDFRHLHIAAQRIANDVMKSGAVRGSKAEVKAVQYEREGIRTKARQEATKYERDKQKLEHEIWNIEQALAARVASDVRPGAAGRHDGRILSPYEKAEEGLRSMGLDPSAKKAKAPRGPAAHVREAAGLSDV